MGNQFLRPVWAEINLDNIAHNISEVVKAAGETGSEVMAVVKADGYGHGAYHVAKTALSVGATRLAVATLDEAVNLRKRGILEPIMIMGYTPSEHFSKIVEYNIIQTVFTQSMATFLSDNALNKGVKADVHIKVDTGMGRIGFLPNEKSIDEITEIAKLPGINIEGIFTHFSSADEEDKTYTKGQLQKFDWFKKRLEEKGISIPIKHAANSAGIIDVKESYFNLLRPGIMIYGLYPSKEVDKDTIKLKEALSLKTRIGFIKEVPEETYISYSRTYKTDRKQLIASLPIGYADGYSRQLSSKGEAIVKGEKTKVLGRVCMDQTMIDVTDIPGVSIGDEVVLYGSQMGKTITIDSVAEKVGTINYEIVCMVSRRVPRVYIKDGKIIDIINYVNPEGI
jgi:alanine racemase